MFAYIFSVLRHFLNYILKLNLISISAGVVDIKMKGCLEVSKCNKTEQVNFPSNSSTQIYKMTKTCCSTDLCNSALGHFSAVSMAFTTITSVFMLKFLIWGGLFHHTHTHTHTHTRTHTQTHTHTHTHTHFCFCELWGHSIGVMVFILYKPYFLSPTLPLPLNLPITGNCAHFYFLTKTHSVWLISLLKSGDMG